jgi:hypothetical protein
MGEERSDHLRLRKVKSEMIRTVATRPRKPRNYSIRRPEMAREITRRWISLRAFEDREVLSPRFFMLRCVHMEPENMGLCASSIRRIPPCSGSCRDKGRDGLGASVQHSNGTSALRFEYDPIFEWPSRSRDPYFRRHWAAWGGTAASAHRR